MSLLVDVHRCPQVPTAPKTAPGTTTFKSAVGVIIIALLPPNSNKDFPKRSATIAPTILPILLEPVAETNGTLRSVVIISPTL